MTLNSGDQVSLYRGGSRTFLRRGAPLRNDVTDVKIYTIVPIIRIELNSIQAIEVVSVVRAVCDRLGSVSIRSSLREGGREYPTCTLPLDLPLI